MEKNTFNSQDFSDSIERQINAMQKMQKEAYQQGYAKGFEDGKKDELNQEDKMRSEEAKVEELKQERLQTDKQDEDFSKPH